MASKRALIVDDSKSARTFLSRILEKYGIDVDTAESAEVAIEYLTRHRPDVIFMDHLMPGMDGFQAVQAIKNEPRTATIPIMMYTSQEGELYLGQARALGAVGVLPKQIRPADVSKVLYQVGLVPDRRSAEQMTFTPAEVEAAEHPPVSAAAPRAADPPAAAPELRALIEATMREQVAELRRFVVSNLENQSERLLSDVRATLRDLAPQPTPAAPAESVLLEPLPAPSTRPKPWPWAAALALLAALAMGALWWRESAARHALETQGVALRSELDTTRTALRAAEARARAAETRTLGRATAGGTRAQEDVSASSAGASGAGEAFAASFTEPVPYGEVPFAGARLETLRQLFGRLRAQGFRGVVEVRSFPGRFCLVGNASEGFSLAPEESAYARCDLVGNPHDDALSPAQRQSLAFANMAGELRRASQGAIEIRIASGSAESTAAAYPAIREALTAGEWNRAAIANNRIEISLRPSR